MNLVKIQNFFTGKFRFYVYLHSPAKSARLSGTFYACLRKKAAILRIASKRSPKMHFATVFAFRLNKMLQLMDRYRSCALPEKRPSTAAEKPKSPPHASVMRRICLYTYLHEGFHLSRQTTLSAEIQDIPPSGSVPQADRSPHSGQTVRQAPHAAPDTPPHPAGAHTNWTGLW